MLIIILVLHKQSTRSGAVFGIYDTLNSAGVTIDPASNDIIWTNGLNQSTLRF
jgi:hypothetical protein